MSLKAMAGILSALIIFLSLSACGGKPHYEMKADYEDKPAYGDVLIDSSIGKISSLNPIIASDSASFEIIGHIFNGLVKYDKNLKLIGDLARKWEISPDGKVITFYLKRGVRWQDGVEFTAKDVKFTYEKFIDPTVKTAYGGLFELVSKVKIVTPYILKVYYKKIYAPALETWGTAIIPYHLLYDKNINNCGFNRHPVGTGPFKFVKWDSAQKIVLEANKGYFDGRPYIDKYIYRIIPDQSVQFMELMAGSIDMMGLTPQMYLKNTNAKKFNKNFNKYKYPDFSYVYLGFNLKNIFFRDKRVRKALSYALNKQEIIKGVRQGLAKEITGPFIPGSWAYNEKVRPYKYNPEKAAVLLKQAGWVMGKKGVLEKNGKEFKFTLITNQGNKERKETALIAQQQFAKIGVKAEIRVIEWSVFLKEFINKRKFDAVILGWSLSRDPDCYDIWHSSRTGEKQFNFVSYKNSEVDALLEAGRTVFDIKKRAKIYRRVHKLIADDAPYIFLYSPYSLPAIHKRVHGIKPSPAGIGYNFDRWYVPAELRKYGNMIKE